MRARLVVAGSCIALAVVAALAAADARSWRAAADGAGGRAPATRLPGDPVGRITALEDDLALRRAVRAFNDAERAPRGFDNGESRARARARAASALATVVESGDARLASRANDLLGVLAARDAAVDAALGRFQAAIVADPSNANAKRNLETLLRSLVVVGVRPGPPGGSGPRGGRGAGGSVPGTGY